MNNIEGGFNYSPDETPYVMNVEHAYSTVEWDRTYVSGRVIQSMPDGSNVQSDELTTFQSNDGGETWSVTYGSTPNMDWEHMEGNPHQPGWQYPSFDERECAKAEAAKVSWNCEPPSKQSIMLIETKEGGRPKDGRIMEPWQTGGVIAGFIHPSELIAMGFFDTSGNEATGPQAAHAWACATDATDEANPAATRPAGAPRWE